MNSLPLRSGAGVVPKTEGGRIGCKTEGLPAKPLNQRRNGLCKLGGAGRSKVNRDDARDDIGDRRGLPTGHGSAIARAPSSPNKPPLP